MYCMLVTPEVSQLEISSLKYNESPLGSLKSQSMFVMAETPQWEMGPYFAMATDCSER